LIDSRTGAASIAGIELHNRHDLGDNIDVKVFGFGCPALLSKDLSEQAKSYITTVVADNDCIPRMSTATMLNAILDIGEYNWIPSARRDIEDFVHYVATYFPFLFTAMIQQRILSTLDDILADTTTLIPPATTKRMIPELFPPGTCVHFYRDGFGITGNVVPCTFFHELDVSRRMIDDHLFQTGYKLIFLDLMRQQHNDHFFRFEIDKER
jgi:hypothetical protein